MDWLGSFRKAIDYMEEHLLQDIGAMEVADAVHISPFYFQKCFKMVTGYSIGEYLRNRRLYLAGLEVLGRSVPGEGSRGRSTESSLGGNSKHDPGGTLKGGTESSLGGNPKDDPGGTPKSDPKSSLSGTPKDSSNGSRNAETRVIDLAYKYGYDTPESFTRAFARFHGLSPMQLRTQPHRLKVFLPLIVEISVKGGSRMDFIIEKREAMRMIGFERTCSFEASYQEIPKFWDEFREKYCKRDAPCELGEDAVWQTIAECMVGEFGVCVEDETDTEHFRYYIAGVYQGGQVPEGMKVFEIPASIWAKFKCVGAMPDALQTVNTRIFNEWLPGNQEFETAFHINIEWYSGKDTDSETYESGIWIPVKRQR